MSEGEGEDAPAVSCWGKWRNILAFWLFGLTNNYPYVIMLSAAFDIIHQLEARGKGHTPTNNHTSSDLYNDSCTAHFNTSTNTSSYRPREPCQHQSTSTVLLADVVPTLLIKLIAPYFITFIPYWIRVLSVIGFSTASFLLIALTQAKVWVLMGVVFASISTGFGEVTFLSLTAFYDKSTVSGWSSGTGAAGVAGALVYAGLKSFLSPKVTLLIQVYIPITMLLVYFLLLGPRKPHPQPPSQVPSRGGVQEEGPDKEGDIQEDRKFSLLECDDDSRPLLESTDSVRRLNIRKIQFFNHEEAKAWVSHVKYIPHLFQYMLPLFVVYFAEYAINQGFFELLYNPNTHLGAFCLDQSAQYRWLQVMYQVGVLISRSSVSLIHFRHFWVFSLLQLANFVFFFVASVYLFLPSFWLTLFLVMYEGLLGGAVYVNAFYTITKEVPEVHREFSLGVASVGDSIGITIAGVSAIFIHKYICGHFIGYVMSDHDSVTTMMDQ